MSSVRHLFATACSRCFFTLLVGLSFSLGAGAQTSSAGEVHPLIASGTLFGAGAVRLEDPYLSPLPYTGWGARVVHESGRLFRAAVPAWSWAHRLEGIGGMAVNPAGTAAMLYAGGRYAWTAHRHFRPVTGVQLLAGGSWDVDFLAKNLTRNVNNPVNVDAATHFNASAAVVWDVPLKRLPLRVAASASVPLAGCMFVPLQGASYYEMFSLGATDAAFHFSSLHNTWAVRYGFTVDMALPRCTLRVGFEGRYDRHAVNGMTFTRSDLNLLVGYTRTLAAFSRRRPAPDFFIAL